MKLLTHFTLSLWFLATAACTLTQAGSVSSRPSATPPRTAPASQQSHEGQVYYVAANEPGASDSNDGLSPSYRGGSAGPWLTIKQAAKTIQAGDTVYIRAGTYYEAGIRFAHSGEPGAPITLANYESEQVIIDGSRAANQSSGIEIVRGQSYWVIQGLEIRRMPRSGIIADGSTASPYREITIKNCSLHDNGMSGARLAALDGFLADHVQAYNNGYYGMDITSSESGGLSSAHGAVRNSTFYNHTGKEGHGLAINQGHDIVVSDNRAYHNYIHGIDVSDMPKAGALSHDILLERNVSYDNGVAGFSINSHSHHVTYRNNLAWGNGAEWAKRGPSSGFLCYESCWHVEYYNNVSVDNPDAGFWIKGNYEMYPEPDDTLLVFRNNITLNNGSGEYKGAGLVVEGKRWQVVSEHNDWGGAPSRDGPVVGIDIIEGKGEIYSVADINQGRFGKGDISIDPRFVDLQARDLRLLPGAPVIDGGTDVGLPFCGEAPDMGAFEWCR